jgi:hypothetical protein
VGLQASNVAVLVAALDLSLVRMLRAAMRTADLSGRGGAGACGCGAGPEDRFEPRRVIYPTPRFEPRPVVHPTPRFEPRPVHRKADCDLDAACSAPVAPEQPPRIAKSPIQPPWKVLPWENPLPPAQVIKVVIRRPDNVNKGSIIDCFI